MLNRGGSGLVNGVIRASAPRRCPPERVLVLGGTGFIGTEIVRAFLRAGSAVTAVARRDPGEWWHEELPGAELVLADAGDPCSLAPLVSRVDHVVYAVGSMLPQESNASPAVDVTNALPAILSLLEILRCHPGTGLTQLSSGGTVYGNPTRVPVSESACCEPITSYGIVKLAAEKYVGMYATLYGVPARILRVSNAYGPLQPAGRSQGIVSTLLSAVRDGAPVRVFGDGANVRDYVYVGDVAHAAVELARRPDGPRVVNLGTGVGHSVLDVVDIVSRVTGARLVIERFPDRGFDVREVVLDVGALSGLVAWDPLTLEDGIERTWQAVRSRTKSIVPVG
jgi:UDP-glucose 4-epimerase